MNVLDTAIKFVKQGQGPPPPPLPPPYPIVEAPKDPGVWERMLGRPDSYTGIAEPELPPELVRPSREVLERPVYGTSMAAQIPSSSLDVLGSRTRGFPRATKALLKPYSPVPPAPQQSPVEDRLSEEIARRFGQPETRLVVPQTISPMVHTPGSGLRGILSRLSR